MRGRDGYEVPPEEDLAGLSVAEVREEFGVSQDTATRWLSAYGLFTPNRERSGSTSEVGKKLLDADPDEFFE